MGDFNAVNNPIEDRSNNVSIYSKSMSNERKRKWRPEIPLFSILEDLNLIDIQKSWEAITSTSKHQSFTWNNKRSQSHIDYIWISEELAYNNIHSFKNTNFNHITNSNHTLLQITLYKNNITNCTKKAKSNRRERRTIFNLKDMDQEKWSSYSKRVDDDLEKQKILSQITNSFNSDSNDDLLQNIWNKIESSIQLAGKKEIPLKKIKRANKPIIRDRGHTPSFKDLRKITNILTLVKRLQKTPYNAQINEFLDNEISQVSKTYPLLQFTSYPNTSNLSEIQWKDWKAQIKRNIKAVKEVNYREEAYIREKEIKKAISSRCQDLQSNQRKMINSLTNQKKNTILLDRIIVKDPLEPYIATDANKVLQTVQQHYEESFKRRNSNFDLLSEEWKNEYLPNPRINSECYNELMDPITEDEFKQTLRDLPNGKASGTSTINYEMLKNLGNKSKTILRMFFSLCLKKGSCPISWKTSTIFPIPKAKDWECDLTNTRPIILLDTSRKLLTKIITNRLASICKKFNILSGPNYAGLPGESTQEPIHLLNNICEEAREKNKELWICFQDTAKAFDTVNLDMLQKAMERIKIPDKAIKFIINLFKNRILKTITDYGLTHQIIAGDGLDQGETISPLLWRIFYDPLINKIQNNPKFGYKMSAQWRENLNFPYTKKIEIRTAATAFMDDTTWIASSAENMQQILNEAAIFYKANDSQINSKKSVLLAINAPKDDQNKAVLIGPNKELLKKLSKEEFTRYLGIHIGERDHKKYVLDLLQREILHITQALNNKKTTDKQTLYILNRILIPRLEYKSQHCFFTEKECKKLTAKYMGKFKNSINVSKTCPNSIILHKGIYNLKSMWEIQAEALISNFTNRINDENKPGISSIIRLKDFQLLNWEPENIIKKHNLESLKIKKNLQANILSLAHSYGITYQGSNFQDLFEWQGGSISIKNIINNQKTYNKSIKSLSRLNIMFIDQIIDQDNKLLLDWQVLLSLTNNNYKGRPPTWYQLIKERIINENDNNKLNTNFDHLIYTNNHHTWTNQISEDNRVKEWIVSYMPNQETAWGKILNKNIQSTDKNKNTITISHHITNTGTNNNTVLTPCQGCELKDHRIKNLQSTCNLRRNQNETKGIKFLNSRKTQEKSIPHKKEALTRIIDKELLLTINMNNNNINFPQQPTIPLTDFGSSLINKWIKTKIYSRQLAQALEDNITKDSKNEKYNYEFYTDGSLKDRGNDQVSMGSSWIQTIGPNSNTIFQTSINSWPSSSKAEAIAIFSALLTVPPKKSVEIHTDSQACIDTFDKLNRPHPKFTKRKLLKIKNWSIWIKIMETIRSKELLVKFTKVKAHDGNFFNEKADALAKTALKFPNLNIDTHNTGTINIPPTWKDTTIDIPIRDFIKEIHKKALNFNWTKQQRNINTFSTEIQQEQQYEWESLWKYHQKNKHQTSIQGSKAKAFWIKISQNELPTLDNLAIRKPKIYGKHQNCPLCNSEKETRLHLFTCPATYNEREDIWTKAEDSILNSQDDTTALEKLEKIKNTIKKLKERTTSSPQEYVKLFMGISRKEDTKELEETTGWSGNRSRSILLNFSNFLREHFRKDIWNHRCKEVNNLEKILGISKKEKTKIKPVKNPSHLDPKKNSTPTPTLQHQVNKNTSLTDLIQEINIKINEWIKYGKKWLGF